MSPFSVVRLHIGTCNLCSINDELNELLYEYDTNTDETQSINYQNVIVITVSFAHAN